jgi:hypothetical protein
MTPLFDREILAGTTVSACIPAGSKKLLWQAPGAYDSPVLLLSKKWGGMKRGVYSKNVRPAIIPMAIPLAMTLPKTYAF